MSSCLCVLINKTLVGNVYILALPRGARHKGAAHSNLVSRSHTHQTQFSKSLDSVINELIFAFIIQAKTKPRIKPTSVQNYPKLTFTATYCYNCHCIKTHFDVYYVLLNVSPNFPDGHCKFVVLCCHYRNISGQVFHLCSSRHIV